MSLKNFLAVGQSFSGGRAGKSPYELRKENLLPRFGHGSRPVTGGEEPQAAVQTDWLDETPRAQETGTTNQGLQTPPASVPVGSAAPPIPGGTPGVARSRAVAGSVKPRKKGLWYYLSFGFLRKSRHETALFQSELMLENVRVVRNDLEDADLELVVVKRKKKKVEPIFSQTVTNPHGNWNVLTARLFDLGQKRR